MKYKLLVLDVDGTLLNDEREISKRTLAALLKVQQMGVRIVLASGRPTYGLMPLAKTLELGNYGGFVLSYNGCQIIKAQNGEILFERRINPEMLPYLEKKARKNGFAIFTYHDDTLITDSPDNEYIKNEALLNNFFAPRAFACSSSSRTTTPAPSPITKPPLSLSNGMDARYGS